ncbi:MAG: sigma-70 family RNA polymerase sigma factor [Chitinophagaceae bacterium]|nr:sigma-70 family RNA polymerase sigma factor [Chitinophagaceae bacterium]
MKAFDYKAAYATYLTFAHNVAFRLCGDQELTKDLVQEVFSRIWERRECMPMVENWKSYLFVLIRNEYMTLLRRKKRISFFTVEQGFQGYACTLEDYEDRERRLLLRQAIRRLPERQRMVVTLRCIHNYKTREIAETLGLALPTVKCHLQQATLNLKAYLAEAA